MYNEDFDDSKSYSPDDKLLRKQNYSKKKFKKTELSNEFRPIKPIKKKERTGNVTKFYQDFEEDDD